MFGLDRHLPLCEFLVKLGALCIQDLLLGKGFFRLFGDFFVDLLRVDRPLDVGIVALFLHH